MTFGEKLKKARKEAGLTQEELAKRMNVSRSAVAKWETDKGMPDIENLRLISSMIDVSIDYLLEEGERITFNETKEPINLEDYEKTGKARDKMDAACLARFPDADRIIPFVRVRKLNPLEWIVDTIVQPKVLIVGDYLTTGLNGNYIVEKDGKQFLVNITKDFITTRDLAEKITDKKFVIGKYRYKWARYELI